LLRLVLFLCALMLAVRADPISKSGAAPVPPAQKRIALTFDDIPRARGAFLTPDERTARIIEAMRSRDVTGAAFFLNPGMLTEYGDRKGARERIAAYVKAGHVIANHSFTHVGLSRVSAADFLSNVDAAENWLAKQPGHRAWLRFPYLDEGGKDRDKREAVRAGLATRRIMNGYVTVDGSDWNMEALALAAKNAGKSIDMAALRDLYVETHVQAADFNEDLAIDTLGRSPAHILLLHETDIAGLFLADLIDALRKDGWEIVSADQAYADPIHAMLPDVPSSNGTRIEALAWAAGIKGPRWYERNEIPLATKLFNARVLHEEVSQ
jgi:peptidoglycan-N-acetylglucosamine deacetylase